jgi:hypothetical protein
MADPVMDRIAEIVGRRRPDLGPTIESAKRGAFDQALRVSLELVLIAELVEFGLDAEGEPTRYGLEIEALIDAIAPGAIEADHGRSP